MNTKPPEFHLRPVADKDVRGGLEIYPLSGTPSERVTRRGFLETGVGLSAVLGIMKGVSSAGAEELPADTSSAKNVRPVVALAHAHREKVVGLAIDSRSSVLITGSRDETIKRWSLKDGALLETSTGIGPQLLKHGGTLHSLAVTAAEVRLVSVTGTFSDQLTLRSLPEGVTQGTWESEGEISSLTTTDTSVAIGQTDGRVVVLNAATLKAITSFRAGNKAIRSITMSPDAKFLAVATADRSLQIWSVTRSEIHKDLPPTDVDVSSLALSRDASLLAWAYSDKDSPRVAVWSVKEARLQRVLETDRNPVTNLLFTSDSGSLVTGDSGGVARVWDLKSGQSARALSDPKVRKLTVSAHRASVNSLCFSPDSGRLYSASSDKTIKQWDLTTGKREAKLTTDGKVFSLAISPDGRLLASGSDANTLQLWELPEATPRRTISGHAATVNCLAVSADGKLLVSGSVDGQIKLWSLSEAELLKTLDCQRTLRSISLSGDGKLLAAAAAERVMLWSLPEGEHIATLRGHSHWVYAVVTTPDGNHLISGSVDRTIRIWSLPDGDREHTLATHDGTINALALTPDSKKLISGSDDTTIHVREFDNLDSVQTLYGHSSPVGALTTASDRRTLASGDSSGAIILWDLNGEHPPSYLFDPEASQTDAFIYSTVDVITGRTITYTLPCGSPIPAGATCVCNCVPGTYRVPVNRPSGSGGGYRICTCIPVYYSF